MASKKKKKRKSWLKKAGICMINIAVFLLIICYGIPLSMYTGRFYGALFKPTQQKINTSTKKVRTYHASYQNGKHY